MILSTAQDTINFARKLASTLKQEDIVALYGDLGSGKTLIAREIIKYFCGENTVVTSPTFNILQTYKAPGFTIYHYDLYRLKSFNEIQELGFDEAFDNLCIIEWPGLIEPFLPKPNFKIEMQIQGNSRVCLKSVVS